MQIVNGYIDLEDMKARLGIADSNDDAKLMQIITAMCRFVDTYCRRRFYISAQDETRYCTPINYTYCRVDDLASVTTLAVDSSGGRTFANVWDSIDYDLIRQTTAIDGMPYVAIQATPSGRYSFYPRYYNSVKVVGKFGFAADSPALEIVREAVALQVARMMKRGDAPFGVAGSGNLGQVVSISDVDPDVKMMLAPPMRRVGQL